MLKKAQYQYSRPLSKISYQDNTYYYSTENGYYEIDYMFDGDWITARIPFSVGTIEEVIKYTEVVRVKY